MPRTKKQPEPETNGAVGEVLTLAEAAAYLRLREAALVSAVHAQGLPGRMVGGEWRFSKTAIHEWLAGGKPSWETRKAAILELAGKYKDDPDLEQIVEEAMRLRGRPLMEDGTYSGYKSLRGG